jgi:hypothetical protein
MPCGRCVRAVRLDSVCSKRLHAVGCKINHVFLLDDELQFTGRADFGGGFHVRGILFIELIGCQSYCRDDCRLRTSVVAERHRILASHEVAGIGSKIFRPEGTMDRSQIFFLEFDFMLLKKRHIFLLKCFRPMMLRLLPNIFFDRFAI